MATQITLDSTAEMFLGFYRKTKDEEPVVPHPDDVAHAVYSEAATEHEQWSRRLSAASLLLGHRLVKLALDQETP